jgi:hypothetical protein
VWWPAHLYHFCCIRESAVGGRLISLIANLRHFIFAMKTPGSYLKVGYAASFNVILLLSVLGLGRAVFKALRYKPIPDGVIGLFQ